MEGKSKVLFVITKGNFGGAQRYVYDLASSLPKDRFEPVVACGPGGSLEERCKEAKIRVIDLQNSEREINLRNDFKTAKELIKIIKEETPNVVHLNSSKVGVLGSLAILYLRIFSSLHLSVPKCIFTAHGWAFNEKSRSALSRAIFYIGHYLTVLICDATIAVSEKAKRDVSGLPFISDKIRVIYNGISPFETLPKSESKETLMEGQSKEARGKKIIFSLSELHKNKGIDVAIRAIYLLPRDIKESLVYCVAGTGEERANLEKLISDLELEDKVKLLGFVPEAKRLLSGCDIFLLPSRTEAFPYAILEAGLYGAPIIATSVGGVPEAIHDMQNGILVHPKNPKEIAEAIWYLFDHPEKEKEFSYEIKKSVSNFFSLDKMVAETISLYS